MIFDLSLVEDSSRGTKKRSEAALKNGERTKVI